MPTGSWPGADRPRPPGDAGPGADAARARRPAAVGDGGQGHRRPRPARQRQRRRTPPGASWPLSDAGRANVERPVAVVLADDECAAPVHAVPRRRPARARPRRRPPARPGVPRLRRGRRRPSPAQLADLVPATAHGRRRRRDRRHARRPRAAASPTGRRATRERGDGPRPGSSRRPTSWPASATALWITEQAMAEVQARLAPGRPPDRPDRHLPAPRLRAGRRGQRPRPDLAGDARPPGRPAVDDARRHRLPAAQHRARAGRGRRPLGRHRHQLRRVPLRLRPHLGRRARSPTPASRPSTRGGGRSTTPCSP